MKKGQMFPKGTLFGFWSVIKEAPARSNNSTKRIRFLKCICTNCEEHTVKEVQLASLVNGKSKSCGCRVPDLARRANTTHGFRQTKLHKVYYNMLNRCYNHKNKQYKDYGGRGITVCTEWREGGLGVFGEWATANGYKDKVTIDRINNNKGYSPSNCRFVTRKINCNNKSDNLYIKHNGIKYTFTEFWEKYNKGVKYFTALHRYRKQGMSAIDAVTAKKDRSKKPKRKIFYFSREAIKARRLINSPEVGG